MTTYYTCTQVTPEVYDAYVKYCPGGVPYSSHRLLAVTLCNKYEGITIFPVRRDLNERHLREFGTIGSERYGAESNILVSVEEFFSQLFILQLEQ